LPDDAFPSHLAMVVPELVIATSARRHGVRDEDIEPAFAHAVRLFDLDDGFTMVIRAGLSGALFESGVVESDRGDGVTGRGTGIGAATSKGGDHVPEVTSQGPAGPGGVPQLVFVETLVWVGVDFGGSWMSAGRPPAPNGSPRLTQSTRTAGRPCPVSAFVDAHSGADLGGLDTAGPETTDPLLD